MMEVTIRFNDRMMADLVIFLEEHYRNCDCPRKHSDIQVFFQDMVRDMLLERKATRLIARRAAERVEALKVRLEKDPVGTLFEALRPIQMTDEDQKMMDEWAAEYEEE